MADRHLAARLAEIFSGTVLPTARLVGDRWVPTFANARYLFGRAEYEYWRDHSIEPDKVAVFNDSVQPIVEAGKAELIAFVCK
jgi:hypothetical protein